MRNRASRSTITGILRTRFPMSFSAGATWRNSLKNLWGKTWLKTSIFTQPILPRHAGHVILSVSDEFQRATLFLAEPHSFRRYGRIRTHPLLRAVPALRGGRIRVHALHRARLRHLGALPPTLPARPRGRGLPLCPPLR